MARGGHRNGKPGSQYANRSDMRQAPTAAPGQQYGKGQAQLEAQQAIPLPSTPPPGAVAQPMPQAAPMPQPGASPFDRPTERPNEPVTAGIPSGAGPGPEALNMPPAPDVIGSQLRALYAVAPNDDLARLIMLRDQGA